jgi:hypothetical protein
LGAITALLVGCTADKPAPTAFEVRVPLFAVGGNADFNLGTHMTGDEEVFTPVPPSTATPADSKGQGEAIFRVSGDGTSVDFRLIASNIDNVIMSHIHCGRPGQNGPIRMWLYRRGRRGRMARDRRTECWRPARSTRRVFSVRRQMSVGTWTCRYSMRSGPVSPTSTCTRTMAWTGSTRDREISPGARFAGSSITDDRKN